MTGKLSNCIWKDGKLEVTYKQPFDMLAQYAAEAKEPQMQEARNVGRFEEWLPG